MHKTETEDRASCYAIGQVRDSLPVPASQTDGSEVVRSETTQLSDSATVASLELAR